MSLMRCAVVIALLCTASTAASADVIKRVSVGAVPGSRSEDVASYDMSGNGDRIVFETQLRGRRDLYLRQRSTGRTTLISVDSFVPAISRSGRYVCFASTASDLVAGDTNGVIDVFVRDLATGTTERASVRGAVQANGQSERCSVSDDKHVAFLSDATNLLPGGATTEPGLYVHDFTSGGNVRVPAGAAIIDARISANGRIVVTQGIFEESGRNVSHVIVRDLGAGTSEQPDLDLTTPPGSLRRSADPVVSADGRTVVFGSDTQDIVTGAPTGRTETFIHDGVARTTRPIRAPGTAAPAGDTFPFAISPDGGSILLGSFATNLVPGAPAPATYVYDVVARSFELRIPFLAFDGPITNNGRVVAFATKRALVSGDTNKLYDVYVSVR